MSHSEKQGGYTLLLLLISLLGGSAVWLQSQMSIVGPSVARLGSSDAQLIAMSRARQALLSYTAHYPGFYGPRGAGAGHFPCPDTDRSVSTGSHGLFDNDGPDPPCGSGASIGSWRATSVDGRLPRHISLPGYRYAFEHQGLQRLDYAVSGRVINNPVNRLVNPETLSSTVAHDVYIASVGSPSAIGDGNAAMQRTSPISTAALLLAIRPAVASWVVQRMQATQSINCLFGEALLQPLNPAVVLYSEGVRDNAIARCVNENSWLQTCPRTSDSQENEGLPSSAASATGIAQNQQLFLLLKLADSVPARQSCAQLAVDVLTIESVPLKDHWFYRNAWHQWVLLDSTSECETDSECSLRFDNHQSMGQLSGPLVLRRVKS